MNEKIKNAFDEVHAEPSLKFNTFNNVVSKNKKTLPIFWGIAPAVAMIALIVTGVIYFTPVSYISIDINPSIEIEVNRFDRVISVTPSNADADLIVNSVKLTHLNYIEAIETLESSDEFEQYNDNYTEITVISNTDENSDEMIDNINACSFAGENVHCFSSYNELKHDADNLSISFGKYRAFLELQEIDPTVTIEDMSHLPMGVIRELIESDGELDIDDYNTPHGSGGQHGNAPQNGNGHQHGKDD